jgi:hypothetical protein
MKRSDCLARQYADQMTCAACGLTWDTNDPEPPNCRKVDRRSKVVKAVAEFDTTPHVSKSPARLPDRLPADLATEMDRAYRVNANGGHTAGIQAAYRIFLDRVEL